MTTYDGVYLESAIYSHDVVDRTATILQPSHFQTLTSRAVVGQGHSARLTVPKTVPPPAVGSAFTLASSWSEKADDEACPRLGHVFGRGIRCISSVRRAKRKVPDEVADFLENG